MNLLEALRSRDGTIVLVDNEFAPREVMDIDGDDRTNFFNYLEGDSEAKQRVAVLVNVDGDTDTSQMVLATEKQATQLWDRFIATPNDYPDLAVLFKTEQSKYEGDRLRLNTLIDFCEETLQVKPLIFHDLALAKDALSKCMLAFVDLYLKAGIDNFEGAIEEHKLYVNAYRGGFRHQEAQWPKVVFLVSSKLPEVEHLQAFRNAIGIRSAFFTGMRKGDLSKVTLTAKVEPWSTKYGPKAKLNHYLEALGASLRDAAESVAGEVDRLELHDLSTLEVLRLSAESETLQSYLTWILSESLASKLRTAKPLQSNLLPAREEMPSIDGQLLPQSVLFELFSEIAVSTSSAGTPGAEFGDIFAILPAQAESNQRLLLAISPACDLARCPPDYQVLCVKGSATTADRSLSSLLGKTALYGKGSHVIRYKEANGDSYAHIEWSVKKGLITYPASELNNAARFKKIARLSEVFAQEIKELALSDASRVGTPVEPTFAVGGSVLVRAKFSLPKPEGAPKPDPLELTINLEDKSYISAILTKGRIVEGDSDLPEILVFTSQFSDWLLSEFIPQLKGGKEAPPKLRAIEDALIARKIWSVSLVKGRAAVELNGTLRYKALEPAENLEAPSMDRLEIIVTVKQSGNDLGGTTEPTQGADVAPL